MIRLDSAIKELSKELFPASSESWETGFNHGIHSAIAILQRQERLKIDGNTSDGYHTFNELYDHRAKLFSVIVKNYPSLSWKSKLHSDGSMYDGMFIVGIDTPNGQASYHYDIEPYWDMFKCKELDHAPEWDGHTSQQAIDRIASLERSINMPWG